jgi:hypothetical protein
VKLLDNGPALARGELAADAELIRDPQVIEEAHHIIGHFHAVSLGFRRLVAQSVSTAIERDYAMVSQVREYTGLEPMSVGVRDVSVYQHHCRTLTCLDVVNPKAAGVEEAIGLRRK